MKDLNLLQPERSARLVTVSNARSAVRTSLIITVIAVACISALAGIDMYLQGHGKTFDQELAQTQLIAPSGKSLPVSETTKRLNKRLTVIQPLLTRRNSAALITTLTNALPSGVRITEITVSVKDKNIRMKGVANTRNDIPDLQAKFDALEELVNTRVTSNINDRTNVQFDLTATIVASGASS